MEPHHPDGQWAYLLWLVIPVAMFILQQIIKPWSDAALIAVKSFREHVEAVSRQMPELAESRKELRKQTLIAAATIKMQRTEVTKAEKERADAKELREWLRKYGSDPFKALCKYTEIMKDSSTDIPQAKPSGS